MDSYVYRWLAADTGSCTGWGCSQKHLKNKRDSHGGFLVEGVDYKLGCSLTAPIVWNVERCRNAFHYRGQLARQEAKQRKQEAIK